MKKVILQYWEESERGWGIRPDGASIHMDDKSCKDYITSIYNGRGDIVPDEYDRTTGNPVNAQISDDIYNILIKEGSVRLFQYELNNLLKLKEVIV